MSTSSSATSKPRALAMIDTGATRARDPGADRRGARLRRLQPHRRGGRDLGADGPVRLGQVDAAARRQRAQRAVVRGDVFVKHGDKAIDVVNCSAGRRCAPSASDTVAMVFQQFALLPWRTVEENVGFGLELAGVPEAERKRARRQAAGARRPRHNGPRNTRMSFPAACSSASALPAPLPPKRRSC